MTSCVWYVYRMVRYVSLGGIAVCKYLSWSRMCGNDDLGPHRPVDLVLLRSNPVLRHEAAKDTRQPICFHVHRWGKQAHLVGMRTLDGFGELHMRYNRVRGLR